MRTQVSTFLFQQLTVFARYLSGPLATVSNEIPLLPVRPWLQLPTALRAPAVPHFTLPLDALALPGVPNLTPVSRNLLARAMYQLRLFDIEVVSVQALNYGLRLHLHREVEQGQMVIYHNKHGVWTTVDFQGPQTRLTNEALQVLRAPLPATDADVVQLLPDDTRLDLVAAYYQLQALAAIHGWTMPASRLMTRYLAVWLHDGCGLVQVRLQHDRELLQGEVYLAYTQAAANTAHDLLRQLVSANILSA